MVDKVQQIVEHVLGNGEISKDELCNAFHVTEAEYPEIRRAVLNNDLIEAGPKRTGGFVIRKRAGRTPEEDGTALTFTYDAPVERPRPDYRLVLIFDPANDLGGDPVCQGVRRFKPRQPGIFFVYAVYCRNDQRMSETTAWTPATSPTDPRIEQLFRELFQVVFSDSPALKPQIGGGDDRR